MGLPMVPSKPCEPLRCMPPGKTGIDSMSLSEVKFPRLRIICSAPETSITLPSASLLLDTTALTTFIHGML